MIQRYGYALLLLVAAATPALADEPGVVYRFDLALDQDEELLTGTGTIRLRNDGDVALRTLPLVLYPNRFVDEDPGLTDVNYDRFYVRWFDEGSLTLSAVTGAEGQALPVTYPAIEGLPTRVAAQVTLPGPVAPGAWAEIQVSFVLDVPDRLGTFGVRWERFVLEAGALPYVPVADAAGARDWRQPPQPARYDLDLAVTWDDPDEPEQIFVSHAPADELRGDGERIVVDTPSPLLVIGDDLVSLADAAPKNGSPRVRVFGEEGDEDRAQRLVDIARSAGRYARRYLLGDAANDPAVPVGEVVFVEAPLRDRFVHATDRAVLYSDRLFHLFFLLKGFHELEAARGAVQSLVRQALADAALGPDRDWICEGFAWVIIEAWLETQGNAVDGDDIRGGLRFLDFIPVVDSLLRAPKFPGADLYYGRIHEIWVDVPDGFARALWRRQRGRIPLEKLRDKIGSESLLALLQESLQPDALAVQGFRDRVEARLGQPADPFLALWLERPSPRQNVVFGDVETLEELPDGNERVRIQLRREGADAQRVGEVGEPVEVGSEDDAGEPVTAVWSGRGLEGHIELVYSGSWFDELVIDPRNRVDQYRGDDETPRFAKLLVNRFRVRVDLNNGNRNEAAIGITLIPGYDYAQAVTIDAFVEEDERGIDLGYARGFGWFINERNYGIGVGGNLNAARLNTGVLKNDAIEETEGDLVSVGGGFSFDTRLDRFAPTWGLRLSGGFEYSDKILGTDFRFLILRGSASFVWSLWRGTQIGAELLVGQIEGTDIPTQRQFDVGGEGAIRGVRTSFFVDNAQFIVRTELRHMLVEDLDIPLLWFIWLRKIQLFGFLDTGDVQERIDKILVPEEDWKWGAGGGVRFHLDGLGVSRFVLGFSVGIRVDDMDDADPQFYFGGGQSF